MLLRQRGRTPLGLVTVVIIAVLQISVCTEPSEDQMCDLRSWYEEAESVGAFEDTNPDVTLLEEKIKALLAAEGGDATVKCSTLREYEEIVYEEEEEGEEGEGEEVEGEGAEREEGEGEGEVPQEGGEDDELEGLLQEDEVTPPPKPDPELEQKGVEKDDSIENEKEPEGKVEEQPKATEKSEGQQKEDQLDKPAEDMNEAPADSEDEGLTLSKGAGNDVSCTKSNKDDCDQLKPEAESGETKVSESTEEVVTEEQPPSPLTPDVPTPPAEANRGHGEAELLAARLLVEQARTEYGGKIKDLEMQLLKLENRMLVEKTEQTNTTNSFTKVENQVLRLENELLRINASFTVLRAENAQIKAQVGTEGKGQQYPALPDNNTTIVSTLVTTHQSRITELTDVITKQSDVIKALDEKSGLLEERNGELRETLVNQADMIKGIIEHIEELRAAQEKQKKEQDKETKRLYDVIASAQDARKEYLTKSESDSDNLKLPNTRGGPVGSVSDNGGDLKGSTVEMPAGSDGKTDEEDKVEEKIGDTQKKPELPQPERHVDGAKSADDKDRQDKTEDDKEGKVEKEVEKEKEIEKENKEVTEDKSTKVTEEKAPSDMDAEAPNLKPKVKKVAGKKGKTAKPKKKKAEKKKGEKKKGGKKAKAAKKAVPVPPPKYVDDSYKEMKDCYSHFSQGRKRDTPMRIRPVGLLRDSDVFCDMRNGGWTVIMRRQDGSMDFYRDWAEYKRGFGGTYGDHFVGLDLIHRLTNQGHYQLRVDLTDWERNSVFAIYDLFRVEGEEESYRLHISGYTGTAGDGFMGHSGMKFSTRDRDNDLAVKDFGGSCATRFYGAWWYNKCYKSNLTGRYYRGGKTAEGKYDGVAWKPWTGSDVSLKRVELKIRRKV